MDKPFLPFALPDIGEEEISEVVDSLRSGWITTGPKVKAFEENFARFISQDVAAIAVNSATAGLHLALEAVGVSAGDEVITTPFTFTATAEVIRYLGAEPVFVDIELDTLNIDVNRIEGAITSKTKAIIPVHFAGLPCRMTKIIEIAKKHDLKVIEDAAHAFPAEYRSQLIGALQGDAAVFSFYATKTITTGEGGMVVTKHPQIAERCRVMRLHGISRDAFDRYNSKKPSWSYDVIAPGFKYNMTDIAASLGLHQLKKARRFQQIRQEIAQKYDQGLKDLPLLLPAHAGESDLHSWHLYVIRLLDKETRLGRDDFIAEMASAGIGCSVHFMPLHLQTYWRERYGFRPEDFPVATGAFKQCVSLPIYTRMTAEQVDRVVDTVKELLSTK